MSGLSVVVTDDDDALRKLIVLVLDRTPEFHVVGEAEDAAACVTMVAALQPDLVLLDLGLPLVSGLEAIPDLKRVAPRTLVVVLSAHVREHKEAEVLEHGADGYLEKGNLVADLVPGLLALVAAVRPGGTS